jgi:transcriptional regulator with XRE-family HTH domain
VPDRVHLLRALRLERDISQEELAEATGLHRTEISLIERGRRKPSLETLVSLTRGLDMTASELVDELEPDRLQMRALPPPGQMPTRKPRRKRQE